MTKMQMWTRFGVVLWILVGLGMGCERTPIETQSTGSQTDSSSSSSTSSGTGSGSGGSSDSWSSSATSSGTGSGSGAGVSASSQGTAGITGSIKWLNTDVSSWPVTANLSARVGGGSISMPYSKSRVWPARDGVNANPWAIVNINGQWYGATFEYFKMGQTSKPMSVLSKTDGKGDHFKVSPLSSWTPRSGERFGIMVSGLARGNLRNVKERSNISMVTWP